MTSICTRTALLYGALVCTLCWLSTLVLGPTVVSASAHVEASRPLAHLSARQSQVARWQTADPAAAPPLTISRARLEPRTYYTSRSAVELPTTSGKWIEVDLSEQKVIAYEGVTPVRVFIVSTGLPKWPTVTGTFQIRTKTSSQTMYGGSREAGDYYYLPNVQWVQYFFEDYAFHGTYWHDNFGRPMSHGCINMTNEDAEWLFFWTGPRWNGVDWMKSTADNPGTTVVVHD